MNTVKPLINKFLDNISENSREYIILTILAFVQFVFLMDYMLLLPLGPHLVSSLNINYKDLSILISSYTFSAAIAGFSSTFFTEKYDRKKVLFFAFLGFTTGPFLLTFSDNFVLLFAARVFSGAFGGVLSALVMTILGDVVPTQRLGKATSFILAANGLATIIGIPLCLFMVENLGWKAPFLLLGGFALILLLVIYFIFPSITLHLDLNIERKIASIKSLIFKSSFVWSLTFLCVLTFAGGFTILPFLSSYMVHNFNFTTKEVGFLFFLGGLGSFIAGPLAGTLSDKFGKQNMFILLNFLSIIPILLVTIFPLDSKVFAIVATALFFMFSTARHVSGMALINGRFSRKQRGQYLGMGNSIQLLAGTFATIVTGHILYLEEGMLVNFDIIGIIAMFAAFLGLCTAFGLNDKSEKYRS